MAMQRLELLDRKPYEMHPSRSNGGVGLCAFFWLLFFAEAKKSNWLSGHPPTVLTVNLKPNHKQQNEKRNTKH
ncbi:hypothetical protein N9W57_05120 [Pseudomonadales bacterium]|nr:hypothetical protein [Pseudomonadales bacterium]